MLLATGGANEGRILLVPWGSRTGMSPAASPYARPVPGGMLREVRIQELTQPWHGSDAAASEQQLWAHKLTGGRKCHLQRHCDTSQKESTGIS